MKRIRYAAFHQHNEIFHLNWENEDRDSGWVSSRQTWDSTFLSGGENSDQDWITSCYKIAEYFFDVWTRVEDAPTAGREVLKAFATNFEQLIDTLHYLGPLRKFPSRVYQWSGSPPGIIEPDGANTLAALANAARQNAPNPNFLAHVAEWLVKLGIVHEFTVEPLDRNHRFYETLVKINPGDQPTALLDVGFGVSQVLPVVTLLFFVPEGSIVLLEQPELHLHPSAQSQLGDLLLHVAETRNLQLIVESHSEHLLRRVQRRIPEPENAFATPETVKAYFCQPGVEGSTIEEVAVNKYGHVENWPANFFGDIGSDIDEMYKAGLEIRRGELAERG